LIAIHSVAAKRLLAVPEAGILRVASDVPPPQVLLGTRFTRERQK